MNLENYIGIDSQSRQIMSSWLNIIEAEDTEAAMRKHAKLISEICGEKVEEAYNRAVYAVKRNVSEGDVESVAQRLRAATRGRA